MFSEIENHLNKTFDFVDQTQKLKSPSNLIIKIATISLTQTQNSLWFTNCA